MENKKALEYVTNNIMKRYDDAMKKLAAGEEEKTEKPASDSDASVTSGKEEE